MNSKERVIRAINHQEPDRVPVGEWGIDHDHVSKIIGRHTYWRNRKDTTIALWNGHRDEIVESLKRDCVALVEKLDYDIISVELVPSRNWNHPRPVPPKQIAEGVWEDSKGNVYKYASSNDSIACMTYPEGKEELDEEDIQTAIDEVVNLDDSIFELVDYIGDRYGNEKAVLFRDIDIYGRLLRPFGGSYDHQLILTAIAPEEIKRMYEPVLAWNQKLIQRCKEHNVLINMQGHDFGMNQGCTLSPAILKEVFFPFMKRVNDITLEEGMIPFFHCCGNIWDILDDFVHSGYRGYQSIQQTAAMDWATVKDKYGERLALWAGVQCETLIEGSVQDLEKEVRSSLKTLMPGGGFIFGSTNSVQFGANTDNYLRALEIVRKEGIYR